MTEPDQAAVVRGRAAMQSLEPTWRELEERLDAPAFQRFDWATAWLDTMGQHGEPWLIVVGDPIEGILPLFRTKQRGAEVLTLIGHGESDYLGPICSSPAMAALIGAELDRLSKSVNLTLLRGLRSSDEASDAMLAVLTRPSAQRPYEQCPAIATSGSWDEYLAAQKKKFRANLKHMRRRVLEQGTVEVSSESVPLSAGLFEEMVEVEKASWKWTGGMAFTRDPVLRSFLEKVTTSRSLPQTLWTCRINGALVSFALVFPLERSWHYYWPSFRDDAWGTGLYLMAAMVEECCAQGVEEFDFLGGDEAYKMRWMTHSTFTREVVIRGQGPMGFAADMAVRTRWRLARSERLRSWRARMLLIARSQSGGE